MENKGVRNIMVSCLLVMIATMSAKAQRVNAFSVQQAVDYALKNSAQVKNALLDIQIQRQTNKEITASAYPHINGTVNLGYNPNVSVQTFPNFIAAGTYGVLVHEGVKDSAGKPVKSPSDFGVINAAFGTKYNA